MGWALHKLWRMNTPIINRMAVDEGGEKQENIDLPGTVLVIAYIGAGKSRASKSRESWSQPG
jgi:hypothetical protein